MQQVLCDIRDAAEALSVGRSTIYDLMNEGALQSVKIGQRRLIIAASITDYVASLAEAA